MADVMSPAAQRRKRQYESKEKLLKASRPKEFNFKEVESASKSDSMIARQKIAAAHTKVNAVMKMMNGKSFLSGQMESEHGLMNDETRNVATVDRIAIPPENERKCFETLSLESHVRHPLQ
jgi:hypothetical protein